MIGTRRDMLLVTAGLMIGLAAVHTEAADTLKPTVITVGEMCGGCVKKITTRLEKMPGVSKIECDIPKKTVTITPVAGKEPTAVAVWDAMAEIGKTPRKMVSPAGTYTERPKG
jgi:periplasmic mercuric ion binding protein